MTNKIMAKYGLTYKQARVAELVTLGFSSDSIAEQLDVKPATIKYHLGVIYKKAGCRPSQVLRKREQLVIEIYKLCEGHNGHFF